MMNRFGIVLMLPLLFGCGPNLSAYNSIGSDFYWYNGGSAQSHSPTKCLAAKEGGTYVDIADHVSKEEPEIIYQDSYLIFCTLDWDTQKQGIYVYKRGAGKRLLVATENPIPRIKKEAGGVTYKFNLNDQDRKHIDWSEIEAKFK